MKKSNIIILAASTLLALASCEMKDELTGSNSKKKDMGALELGVLVKQPTAQTRAELSATTFPVEIAGVSAGVSEIKKVFESVAQMPASISLPVGEYTVTAHTSGKLEKQMSSPYYGGSTQMTITKNITTSTSVVCKMQNSKIQMKYNTDFSAAFQSWTITVDDNSSSVLTFDNTDSSPNAIYWHFDENTVDAITVNIRAVTVAGTTVTESRTYKKQDAAENYENVNGFFGGGEALDINMGAVTSLTGKVTGATINTFITFEDQSDTVEIPVSGNEGEGEGEENPDNSLTLLLPQDVSYSISDESSMPARADALITAPAGLQSIKVIIIGGNNDFDEILNDLRMDGQSFKDGGVDLVGNNDFNSLLNSVSLPDGPTIGDTEYTFPIGVFFTFLNITGATDQGKAHQFNITVTDKSGDTATGTFKVTITE